MITHPAAGFASIEPRYLAISSEGGRGVKTLEGQGNVTAKGRIRKIFFWAGKFSGRKAQNDRKTGRAKNVKSDCGAGESAKIPRILNHMKGRKNIMNENSKDRPPAFPPELLNRPRPRGMVAAQKAVGEFADRVAINHLLDLAATLQQRMSSAVGLIDAGEVAKARALLDAQVTALDALDLEPVKR